MAELKRILVNKILPSDDRSEGGLGDIKKLAQSIKMLGLINPITLREIQDGEYRYVVVAGRRRLAAVKLLKQEEVEAVIYGEDEEIPDEEIALAENINRLDLHPLDEGAKYKALIASGKNIEDLSKTYDRSQAHIYQRMKLCDLSEELKVVFRAGGITITQAAKIASVPSKVQQQIFEKVKDCDTKYTAASWWITDEINKAIKSRLFFDCEKCKTCTKRTWYSNNNLFPELNREEDYCLDSECYKKEIKTAAIEDIKEFFKHYSDAKKVLIYFSNNEVKKILREIKKVGKCEVEVLNEDGYTYTFLTFLDADELEDLPKEAKEKIIPAISVLPFDGKIEFAFKTTDYEKYFSSGNEAKEDGFKEEKILIEKLPEQYREAATKDLQMNRFFDYSEQTNLRKKTFIELLKDKEYDLSGQYYFCTPACLKEMLDRFGESLLFAFELVMGTKTTEETFIEDMADLSLSTYKEIYASASFINMFFFYNQEVFIEGVSELLDYTEAQIEKSYQKNVVDFLSEKYKEKTGAAPEETEDEDEIYVKEEVIDIEPFRSDEE